MATLNATLSLTSTDVSSSAISFTVSDALIVGTPNIGMSRDVAAITSPTTLVPASVGTKYCYVKHMGLKSNGVSANLNTVNIQTVTEAPVRQVQTITFTALPVDANTITATVDGVSLAAVTYTTTVANTFTLFCAALAAQPGVLKAEFTTISASTVVTVTSANLGDSTTVVVADTVGGTTTVATAAGSGRVLASGASSAILRPGEFMFLPVKGGEGLSAISAGVIAADACMLEYAYWTKSVE